ncbi:MAG TPA: hypothetical protein VFK05_37520 [Polyangiaceae bacterium]|nr:hypothetical protein [Polyangiaceae bacterium]
MPAPKLETRATRLLGLALLLTAAIGCHPRSAPTKKQPAHVAAPRQSASASASASPSSALSALASASATMPSANANASACGPAAPAPIALTAMKTTPPSVNLVPLRAQPGLWLADENSALLDAKPALEWADGPLTLASDGSSATRGVTLARLPKALRGWLGRPVKVLGASGAVCETRLQRFALRAKVTPDPRTAEFWEGCAEPPLPKETIAKEIWRLSAVGGRTLIAEFSAPCKGALLAVDPNLPAPAIAAPEPASAEVGAAVMSAFRALPAYAALQARFRAEHPEAEGAWDDRDARRSVSKLSLPGTPELLFVSVETGSGCAGFSASLSAIWQSGPSGPSKVLTAIDNRRLSPSAIVDFDGSGSSLLLGPDGPLQMRSVLRAGSFERSFLSDVPYFAGPC